MRFYLLKSPDRLINDAVTDYHFGDDIRTGDAPSCPACQRIVGALKWVPPYRVEIEFRCRLHGDIAFGVEELLLSEQFVELFYLHSLTGLEVLGKAEVIKVKPRSKQIGMPQYHVARVRRSNASIDDIASNLVYEEPWTCSECRIGNNLLKIDRLVIDPSSWHGEDLFVPRGITGIIVASQRFADWSVRYSLKNVNLIPAEEFRLDYMFMAGPDSE